MKFLLFLVKGVKVICVKLYQGCQIKGFEHAHHFTGLELVFSCYLGISLILQIL